MTSKKVEPEKASNYVQSALESIFQVSNSYK